MAPEPRRPGEGESSMERVRQATVDLSALRANFAFARELAGGREVIAVVKADGYGHGAPEVARCLEGEGCERLAVMTADEACVLREAGIRGQILILGGLGDGREAHLAGEYSLAPVVHEREGLALAREAAEKFGRTLAVHLEVDTGMRRMGTGPEEALALAEAIGADSKLELDGTYTHFASADSPDPKACLEQIRLFRDFLGALRGRGLTPGTVHAANSSALLAGPEIEEALPEADAVRPGLMLYGACSATHEDPERRLRPAMSVRARVAAVREITAGEAVGYGSTWRADGPARIATLPLGYADGVLRSLSNRGEVWLAGGRRPIVGRVSMDSVTVAVLDPMVPVAVGDPATFFGLAPEGGPGIRVEAQAEAAGTLAYELLVGVGDRVSRVYVDGQ
ncbi:MAG TPA: alanine racemase [Myxococcales bacterium]|nr:alanine racemase [Myxococcales bacterium]